MKTIILASIRMFIFLTILTGIVYPLSVTIISQLILPYQANASILTNNKNLIIGSELLGQHFTGDKYFHGRVSATSPAYNPKASSGSNLSTANPSLISRVQADVDKFGKGAPLDLLTASASGLDPHITPEAAYYQARRIAKTRGVSIEVVKKLIQKHTESRTLGILGEYRVNVLKINLALDEFF